MKLLVRPRWEDGESWPGYLLRLAHLNGLPALPGLTLASGMTRFELMNEPPTKVLESLGVVHSATPAIELRIGSNPCAPQPKVLGRYSSAICPLCIKTDRNPHFRARWEWPLEVACGIHGVQLVPRCHRCNEHVNLQYGTFMVCRCGTPYRDWRTKSASFNSTEIRAALETHLPIEAEQTFLTAGFRERSAFNLLRNITYAVGLRSKKDKDGFPRLYDIDDRFEVVRNAAPWFDRWPDRFIHQLHRYGWSPGASCPKQLNRHSMQASLFSQIDDIWQQQKKLMRNVRPVVVADEYLSQNPEQISLKGAARLLGVTSGVVEVWRKRGQFPNIKAVRRKSKRYRYVPRIDVEDMAAMLKTTLSFDQAAQVLGLTHRPFRSILSAQVFEIKCMGSEWISARTEPTQLRSFKSALFKAAKKTENINGLRPFVGTMLELQVRQGPLGVSILLDAMLKGELPSYKKARGKSSLAEIYLHRAEVRRFNFGLRCELALSA